MAVKLRGSKYHYRFMVAGVDYSGVCVGCTTKAQAEKYEQEQRRLVRDNREAIRANRTVAALVENYRKELSGGSLIALSDAFNLAAAKPSKRIPKSSYAGLRRTYWSDFAAFMAATYPDVTDLSAVRRTHCEAYVTRLVKDGRFIQEQEYVLSHKKGDPKVHIKKHVTGLSPKTIREIVCVCKSVFSRLEEDAGITRNPWTGVVLPAMEPVPREVFTRDELKRIGDGLQNDPFCQPLFIVAANTGLTEGDICTLKWSEIDFAGGMIRRVRRKTGVPILIPLLPELAAYLQTLPRDGEYVLPDHAQRYLERPSSVSYHIKAFLDRLGIQTRREVPGRKSVSVKDLHSMRHVFCYTAKRAGIPESTIQKYVGHAVVEMTRHYADHDTEDDLKFQMQKIPALFVENQDNQGEVENIRQRFVALLPSIPVETLRRWLDELSVSLNA